MKNPQLVVLWLILSILITSFPQIKEANAQSTITGIYFPEPNSIDIPLDTNVSISFSWSPEIVELIMSPEVAVKEKTIESWQIYGALHRFHFSELLEPSTTYTVTITYATTYGTPNSTRTWNFTTTNEIPQLPTTPKDDQYNLTTYYLLLIFIVIISGVIIGLYLSRNREKQNKNKMRG